MSVPRVAVLLMVCLAVLSASQKWSYADQVDDLLAGRPVEIKQPAVAAEEAGKPVTAEKSPVTGVATGQVVSKGTLSENSWEVRLAEPTAMGIADEQVAATRGTEAVPSGTFSAVPEPSAIALAGGALVYFLIFFRRRYSY